MNHYEIQSKAITLNHKTGQDYTDCLFAVLAIDQVLAGPSSAFVSCYGEYGLERLAKFFEELIDKYWEGYADCKERYDVN